MEAPMTPEWHGGVPDLCRRRDSGDRTKPWVNDERCTPVQLLASNISLIAICTLMQDRSHGIKDAQIHQHIHHTYISLETNSHTW